MSDENMLDGEPVICMVCGPRACWHCGAKMRLVSRELEVEKSLVKCSFQCVECKTQSKRFHMMRYDKQPEQK